MAGKKSFIAWIPDGAVDEGDDRHEDPEVANLVGEKSRDGRRQDVCQRHCGHQQENFSLFCQEPCLVFMGGD